MYRFYAANADFSSKIITLSDPHENHHIIHVLRLKPGDQLKIFNEMEEEAIVECEEIYTDLRAAQEDFLKAGKQVCGLDLSGRRMPSLTRGVSIITSLTYLDVSDNNFKELPKEISALKELKVLNLQGNPLPAGEVDKVRKLLPKADVKF